MYMYVATLHTYIQVLDEKLNEKESLRADLETKLKQATDKIENLTVQPEKKDPVCVATQVVDNYFATYAQLRKNMYALG